MSRPLTPGQLQGSVGRVFMAMGLTFLARADDRVLVIIIGLVLFSYGLSWWHEGEHRD